MIIITREEMVDLIERCDFILCERILYAKSSSKTKFVAVYGTRTLVIPSGSRFYKEADTNKEVHVLYDDPDRAQWHGVKLMTLMFLSIVIV